MGKKKTVKRTTKSGSGVFEKIKPILLGGGPYFVISVLILTGIYFAGRYAFLDSDFFAIKRIVINKDKDYSLKNGEEKLKKLYLGRNIFSVDLQQVRMMIKNEFPYLRDVEVRRGMPESLEIDILSRTPVAVIDGAGGILIDAEGVVLALRANNAELPRIKGLSFFLNVPSRGEKISSEFLDRAIEVLGMFKEKIPSFYNEITYIDVANRKNLLIGVKGVEIRMGPEGFAEKLDKLGEILYDPKIDLSYVRYIDLRFDSPVIAPK